MADAGPGLDLSVPRRVHVVAAGGAGMSAIALVLARLGHAVSGSDLKDSRNLERLRAHGVAVTVGHAPGNVPPETEVVICSTAVRPSNPELREARARGIPVLRRADALAAIVATRRSIAVAGSHGKTTTSSMLALVLRAAGLHPSFLVGGELNEIGTNAALDDGEWLVVEADESDGTFLALAPEAAIVTSIEPDHLDHYGDFAGLRAAFVRFAERPSGPVVVSADDPEARALATQRRRVRTYGFAADASYRIDAYEGARVGSRFVAVRDGEALGVVELPVPGRHNVSNAMAATAMALELGVPFEAATRALAGFGGVARRFQFRGERDGVTYVDDYAHLPREVAGTIAAAREGGWSRVIAVFQPHRFSRTASLWRDFADSFDGADQLVVTDVYPAGEQPRPGVSGRLILRAVLDAHPDLPVVYLPRATDLARFVPGLVRTGDLVLTLGAGDLTAMPDLWLGARDGGASRGAGTAP